MNFSFISKKKEVDIIIIKRYVDGYRPGKVIVSVETFSNIREVVIFTRSGHEWYDLKLLRSLESNYTFDI